MPHAARQVRRAEQMHDHGDFRFISNEYDPRNYRTKFRWVNINDLNRLPVSFLKTSLCRGYYS